MIGQQFRGFGLFSAGLQDLLQAGDEVGLIEPVLRGANDRGRHLLQVPARDFARKSIDLRGIDPSRGLRQDGIPIAFEADLQLHHDDRERVILKRTREPFVRRPDSAVRQARQGALPRSEHTPGFAAETHLSRGRRGAQAVPKLLEVDGFGHVVEE